MSLSKFNFVACNPKNEESVTPAVEASVDAGAELTSLRAWTNRPRTGNRNSVGQALACGAGSAGQSGFRSNGE
jgi:hypothetical protein